MSDAVNDNGRGRPFVPPQPSTGSAGGTFAAPPSDLDLVGHTVTRVIDGVAHSQHYGPDLVVQGSIHVIDLPPGVDVFVTRHYAAS